MFRFISSVRKELLILIRDKGGLAIMFFMPMALLILMALIQDAPFRDYQESNIPLLLVNRDSGVFANSIEEGLQESGIFNITKNKFTEHEAKEAIEKGLYQIGVFIPQNTSSKLKVAVFRSITGAPPNKNSMDTSSGIAVNIFFAPEVKRSFRSSVLNSLKQYYYKTESSIIYDFFTSNLQMPGRTKSGDSAQLNNILLFREFNNAGSTQVYDLNSVQHNVPAWTIFGMFFIVVSMAGSIIKERDDGSYLRVRTMPVSPLVVLGAKITAYLLVCLSQCLLMLLAGIFLMPLVGLPQLIIGSNYFSIGLIALCTGLAAAGFGILTGTFFNTHHQASTFGAVSIVIMAALGGIWVPVFVMPEQIRLLAEFSPLYWSLNAFQNIFLLNAGLSSIGIYSLKLITFFMFTLAISYCLNSNKNR